jgi:hypothetical protein
MGRHEKGARQGGDGASAHHLGDSAGGDENLLHAFAPSNDARMIARPGI